MESTGEKTVWPMILFQLIKNSHERGICRLSFFFGITCQPNANQMPTK
jgi:hypothetical protein